MRAGLFSVFRRKWTMAKTQFAVMFGDRFVRARAASGMLEAFDAGDMAW
jgi:hypothetical protein